MTRIGLSSTRRLGMILAATLTTLSLSPAVVSPARAATPELTQVTVFGLPSGGGFISYPEGQFCGLFHLFMLDSSDTPSAFTVVPLADGLHSFRFVTSTFLPASDTIRLELNLRPCCQPADLVVNPGQTSSTTIDGVSYTVSGFSTAAGGFDSLGTCAMSPDGFPDFVSTFTLQVSATDGDGDGIPNASDNCPGVANADQLDTDNDSFGDACDADDDNDGVSDAADNCPLHANADQSDFDADGVGDFCDADDDADGVADGSDLCLGTAPGFVVDATGCSIDNLCPCEATWKSHGAYVACVASQARRFEELGLIDDVGAVVSPRAQSACS